MKALGFLIAPLAALALVVPAAQAADAGKHRDHGVHAKGHIVVARARFATPGINRRIHRQANRIRVGIRRGDLTRNEARRVRSNLRNIRQTLRRARRDGLVTGHERRRITGMLNRNSRAIARLKNNRRYAL